MHGDSSGRRELVEAAFLNISPHHSLGRPMKVGKEEIMGALAAMELWVNGRDHEAEWKEWERKLNYVSDAIRSVPTVTTKVTLPGRRSNDAPKSGSVPMIVCFQIRILCPKVASAI